MKKLCILLTAFFFFLNTLLYPIPSYSMDLGDLESSMDLSSFIGFDAGIPIIPYDNQKPSSILALQLLTLSSGYTAESFASLFASSGFEVLDQQNFGKDQEDPSHTCAFTIGKGTALMGLVWKPALLISIRGTYGGEWYSNFDFCPSHMETSEFSENFLYAAEDVFLQVRDYIDANPEAQILICGHSRGAACANLLGLLVNAYTDSSKVYVYTYATPATLHTAAETYEDSNIFNYINPCDLIPKLPLSGWGYHRAGTDLLLPATDPDMQQRVLEYEKVIFETAPSITSYYYSRNPLNTSGSDPGVTPFELMLLLSKQLTRLQGDHLELPAADENTEFTVSDDSVYKPLADIMEQLAADDFSLGTNLLLQHLPVSYFYLINQYRLES